MKFENRNTKVIASNYSSANHIIYENTFINLREWLGNFVA
jgi:hypothetical protein